MTVRYELIELLSDGRFHSGEDLAARLGVTRAAVWKQVRSLEGLGFDIQAVRGKGYRLAAPLELLDAGHIRRELGELPVADVRVLREVDSTNTWLRQAAMRGAPSGSLCLAEYQHRGRGRRGRSWVSPFGANICLSLLWRFATGPGRLSGLSLASGVAVLRALQGIGAAELALKWPNDIFAAGAKLAGILVEIDGEATGPSQAVIGIGCNVRMTHVTGPQLDRPWISLHALGVDVSRNGLAAGLIKETIGMLQQFESSGLAAFVDEWRARDLLAGRPVVVDTPTGTVEGVSESIDAEGALLVRQGRRLLRFFSGEVSLRAAS